MKYIYLRGVGRSEKPAGFSHKLREAIDFETGVSNQHLEFLYQDIIEDKVDKFFNANFKKPKWYRFKKLTTWLLRRAVFDYAVDATAYHTFKEDILHRLHKLIRDDEEVTFICHSLGCTVAYDYIQTYNRFVNVKCFITFGCNIPWFKLGEEAKLSVGTKWVNYFEPNDILAMPMKPMAVDIVKDVEHNNRTVKGSTVGAHAIYWNDSKLHKKILKEL